MRVDRLRWAWKLSRSSRGTTEGLAVEEAILRKMRETDGADRTALASNYL